MRKLLTATLATLFCLTLVAAPASAKKPKLTYTPWYSTVDCGQGPVRVVSAMEDEWSDLLAPRIKYVPVEWHLDLGGGRTYDAYRPGKAPKHTVTCAYRDDFASGTVVLKRTGHLNRAGD